jgi:hypothetical protein
LQGIYREAVTDGKDGKDSVTVIVPCRRCTGGGRGLLYCRLGSAPGDFLCPYGKDKGRSEKGEGKEKSKNFFHNQRSFLLWIFLSIIIAVFHNLSK